MVDCRVCLSREPSESLITPCNCKGSISAIHKECLEHWLREKYSRSFSIFMKKAQNGPTGLHCELCKYEYIGTCKLGSVQYIFKSIKESKLASSILLNIVVVAAITYKLGKVVESIPPICQALKQSIRSSGFKKLAALLHSLKLLGNASAIAIYCFSNILLISVTGKMLIMMGNRLYRLEIASLT